MTQQIQPGQVIVSPYVVTPASDIGTLLASITPLIMMMMVFMMITPMMKGMAGVFASEGESSSLGHSSSNPSNPGVRRGRMFEKDYEYVITPKGIEENKSFRGKVERWLDGSVFAFPFGTREGLVLALFARYPGVGLTLDNIWDKSDKIGGDMTPTMIEDTCDTLEKRGLIRKVG